MTVINALDYATTFTFPVKGSKTAEFAVTMMKRNHLWMICRRDPAVDIFDVYTLDGAWVSILVLPHDDVAPVSFERDRAIAIAHLFAESPMTGPPPAGGGR